MWHETNNYKNSNKFICRVRGFLRATLGTGQWVDLQTSFDHTDTRLVQPSLAILYNGAGGPNFAPIDLKPWIWTFQTRCYRSPLRRKRT